MLFAAWDWPERVVPVTGALVIVNSVLVKLHVLSWVCEKALIVTVYRGKS